MAATCEADENSARERREWHSAIDGKQPSRRAGSTLRPELMLLLRDTWRTAEGGLGLTRR